MQEIFGIVAPVIHRFDVQLASPMQKFPSSDESLLTLGVSRPVLGHDIQVALWPRKANETVASTLLEALSRMRTSHSRS